VPAHGVLGVIGPNGAGKSTLVDVISGFLPHASGTVARHPGAVGWDAGLVGELEALGINTGALINGASPDSSKRATSVVILKGMWDEEWFC
jgi:ABC-type polysaccharide/polyol phosphate transport system ATPase subunit